MALEVLKGAPEEIRHIVLFTDGWGNDTNLLSVSQEIADAGITLSVLGTGEGSGENAAEGSALRRRPVLSGPRPAGHPRYLHRGDPASVAGRSSPRVRSCQHRGGFASHSGLTATPALRGYVLTKSKPTARVPLELGPGDPLFATWQRGLGRAAVWTSDATVRWSADWVELGRVRRLLGTHGVRCAASWSRHAAVRSPRWRNP